MQMPTKHIIFSIPLLFFNACGNNDEGILELVPPEAINVQEVKKIYYEKQKQKSLKPLTWKTLAAFQEELSALRAQKNNLTLEQLKVEIIPIRKLASKLAKEKVPKGIRDPAQIVQLQNSLMTLANSEKAAEASVKEEVLMLLDGMNFTVSRMARQVELSNEARTRLDQ